MYLFLMTLSSSDYISSSIIAFNFPLGFLRRHQLVDSQPFINIVNVLLIFAKAHLAGALLHIPLGPVGPYFGSGLFNLIPPAQA